MRLEQLKYFISIAKTQSINRTSIDFFTTHQGVSKALRQLEDEMGAPLFVRSPKGMALTKEGEILLPVAEQCVHSLHQAQLQISHHNRCQELAGTLQIWGTLITNTILLPTLLDDFNVLYPNIHYKINEANALDILNYAALHNNCLGLVAILHNKAYHNIYKPYIDQISFHFLRQDEYVCVVGAKSPLADYSSISLKEFTEYPIAMLETELQPERKHPLIQLLSQSANYIETLSTQSRDFYRQAIISGRYVGISSRLMSNTTPHPNIVMIPFKEDLSLDITLITNTRPNLDAVGEAFVELVNGEFH